MLLLSESTLFFLNLTSEFRSMKLLLGGRVKDWALSVRAYSQGSQSNTGSQPASVPPSTIFSKSTTTTTASKATTVKSQSAPKQSTSNVFNSEDALVGGFDDVEVDESLEREAAFQSTMRGRMPVEVRLPISSQDQCSLYVRVVNHSDD